MAWSPYINELSIIAGAFELTREEKTLKRSEFILALLKEYGFVVKIGQVHEVRSRLMRYIQNPADVEQRVLDPSAGKLHLQKLFLSTANRILHGVHYTPRYFILIRISTNYKPVVSRKSPFVAPPRNATIRKSRRKHGRPPR
mgnify:CR=1 FL=1